MLRAAPPESWRLSLISAVFGVQTSILQGNDCRTCQIERPGRRCSCRDSRHDFRVSLSPSYSSFKIVNSIRAIKPPRNERCCWDGKGHHISVVFSNSSRDWTELIRMKWRFKWSSYRPVVSSRWQETPMMSPLPHFTAETKRRVYLGWVPFHTARASQKLFYT